tara:strand:+ start:427 stop:702 length:276 start_codon:yes stop_codon:yes gene_type:complete
MKNVFLEIMRRFATKNLHEQDSDSNNNGYPDDTESTATSQHSGKTIYLVKVGSDIIEKTFNINTAKETIADHNFDLPKYMEKAKLFTATVK